MARPATTSQIAEAVAELETRDPVIARLHAEAGLPILRAPSGTPFEALVLSIAHQQLAGAAAAARPAMEYIVFMGLEAPLCTLFGILL